MADDEQSADQRDDSPDDHGHEARRMVGCPHEDEPDLVIIGDEPFRQAWFECRQCGARFPT